MARSFCMVLKNAFHVSGGFLRGKQSFKKNHKTYFFGPGAGDFPKLGELFSGDLSNMQSMPAEELLGRKHKIWENFFSFGINSWQECQFCILRVQRKKNLNKDILFYYFWAENFLDFRRNYFRQSCQTCNPCYRECLYKRKHILRKPVVCLPNLRLWAKFFWILSIFRQGCQKISFCVCRGIYRRKDVFLSGKKIFSDFEPQIFDSEKQFGMFVVTAP